MKLRTFSVAGEALNFGARRMETIIRVAWLPVVLLLVLNMATVFAYLSIILERLISFADVAAFTHAQAALSKLTSRGFAEHPREMYSVMGISLVLQAILVASFMAPLIRYAGLGERPASGAVKVPFGSDQIRYLVGVYANFLIMAVLVLGPIAVTAYYVWKYLTAAMAQTFASFPNPESLHTIELMSAREALTSRGVIWLYDIGVPLAAAAPFALVFWLILIAHFHPKNRQPGAGAPNLFLRGLWTFIVPGVLIGLPLLLLGKAPPPPGLSAFAVPVYFSIYMLVALYTTYFNLRLAPYPGIVVCRKSLAPAGLLRVTRGWNILRVLGVFAMISLILFFMQLFINTYLFVFIRTVTTFLYAATATATQLVNSGVEAEWVRVFFVWAWNVIKILVNILWTLFSYGVVAGYLGRLYRESERADGEPVARAPWRA